MTRIFSGVQPTGDLHLGNYLGAIRQFAKMQDGEAFFCIVDMHAITVKHDPAVLARHSREIAAAYIASGVDPQRSTIFIQSQVPGHAELAWLLNCVARMGWLERMTQFREKTNSVPPANLREVITKAKTVVNNLHAEDTYVEMDPDIVRVLYQMVAGVASNAERASVGLFTYPVLMAADILAYKATHVPVGDDQKQHLNLAADIAQKFNHDYGEVFPIPQAVHAPAGARVMSLQDGTKKMSKSDPDPLSRINLSDSNDVIVKKIRRATAYTLPFPANDEELIAIDPDLNCASVANLINLYIALTGMPRERVYDDFGGKGYGVFKPALADAAVSVIEPIRTAMNNLLIGASDQLDRFLADGAEHAHAVSSANVREARKAMGFAV
jgi:tryptophanyl-tRNA synthetase